MGPIPIGLGAAAELFSAAKAAEGASPRTVEWYRMIVGRAVRRYGDSRPVDAIPAAELRVWLLELRGSLAPESIAGYVRGLKAFGNWCAAEEVAAAAGFRALRRPKVPRRLIAPFSDPELRSLLALADERERALALVLLDTGLRLSELASLRVGDVRADGTLHVMGKGAKERIVPIGASARSTTTGPTFPRLVENEFFVPDALKFRQLARERRAVATLWQATTGHLERSPRYVSLFGPQGFGDELRAVFKVGPAVWGAVIASRRKDDPPFSEREIEFFASVGPLLGEAYRRVLIAPEAERNTVAEGPGLVIMDGSGQIESATPAGYRWLEELEGAVSPLASALRAVDAATRAAALGTVLVGPARARVRTRTGEWLVLHGSLLDGRHDGRVAVILELARPAEIASILLEGYGLTPREREVVALVLQGQSTQEIATSLAMSAYTVQDHLKSVFTKVGVGSRSELVGLVFRRDYFPREATGTRVSSSGFFAEGG